MLLNRSSLDECIDPIAHRDRSSHRKAIRCINMFMNPHPPDPRDKTPCTGRFQHLGSCVRLCKPHSVWLASRRAYAHLHEMAVKDRMPAVVRCKRDLAAGTHFAFAHLACSSICISPEQPRFLFRLHREWGRLRQSHNSSVECIRVDGTHGQLAHHHSILSAKTVYHLIR